MIAEADPAPGDAPGQAARDLPKRARPARDRPSGGRPSRLRLDQLLVERGLFPSREKAKRAVMAGTVEVDGQRSDKPGTSVSSDVKLEVIAKSEPYVSRAGRKLEAALDHFNRREQRHRDRQIAFLSFLC